MHSQSPPIIAYLDGSDARLLVFCWFVAACGSRSQLDEANTMARAAHSSGGSTSAPGVSNGGIANAVGETYSGGSIRSTSGGVAASTSSTPDDRPMMGGTAPFASSTRTASAGGTRSVGSTSFGGQGASSFSGNGGTRITSSTSFSGQSALGGSPARGGMSGSSGNGASGVIGGMGSAFGGVGGAFGGVGGAFGGVGGAFGGIGGTTDDTGSSSIAGSGATESNCTPNPCEHDGECIPLQVGYLCRCSAGHAGDQCNLPVFQGLGQRAECDQGSSFRPTDVSGDGRVVVGTCSASVPFRWTQAMGYEALGILGTVNGTNRNGSIVVGKTNNRPYRLNWSRRELTLLPGPSSGYANAISDDDRVVVGSIDNSSGKGIACRWVGSSEPEELGILPGGAFSGATAVSSDGTVIAGSSDSVGMNFRGFRWTAIDRSLTALGPLVGRSHSVALGMSTDGSVVVGESFSLANPSVERAFLWTALGGLVDLGTLPEYLGAYAVDVSSYDSIVAVQLYQLMDQAPFDRAAIWDRLHGIRLVSALVTAAGGDTTGWVLNGIVAISMSGKVVVGYGTNPLGVSEPWIARLP